MRRVLVAPFIMLLSACSSSPATPAAPSDAGAPWSDAADDAGPDAINDASNDAIDEVLPDGATEGGLGYADPAMWLCGAGTPHDYCLDSLTATALNADGTQAPVAITPATAPAVDCFYVYPSIDPTDPPGNLPDFSKLPDILDPVREQAAPFSQVCKVYAPLYHQATYQSYYDANASVYLEKAYADVAAAFAQYMSAFNQGRDFVLIGHSQGSHMLRRLLQREIEGSPDVAKHLVVAILAGAFGDITVPKGQFVGGTFQSTPLCTQDTQRGCVITFNSFAKGYEPTASYGTLFPVVPAGQDLGCTNPAALGGGAARLAGAWFFTQFQNPNLSPPENTGVSTTFAVVRDFYTGECLESVGGFSFFQVGAAPNAGDQRTNPIPFNATYYAPTGLGLHLIDFSFPMEDLLAAVTRRL